MAGLRFILSLLLAVFVTAGYPFPAAAYQASTVSDGGTIKGKVVFQGRCPHEEDHPDQGQGGLREHPRGAGDRRRARTKASRTPSCT